MPKKKVGKASKTSTVDSIEESKITSPRLPGFKLTRRKIALVLLIIGLILLAYYKKNWFVAALVNGQPITTLELNQKLNKLYKERTLNQMINEKIIEQEATRKSVRVLEQQVGDKVTEVESQHGGKEVFDSLLKQQGLERDDFIRQVRLQLTVAKLYEGEIDPTDEEIKKFMDANKNSPEATDEAKFKQTAKQSLRQQKLSKVFNEKFDQLKKAAKVQIF